MKKSIHLLATLSLSTLTAFSNTKKITPAPFFYEITGNNISYSTPVYILGTCHTLSPNDYDDHIRNKIENTQLLISEFPSYSTESTTGKHHLNRLNFIYNKFIQQNISWFREQFIAIKSSPQDIKEKLALIQTESCKLQNPQFSQSWLNQLTKDEQSILNAISAEANIDLSSIHPAVLWQFIDFISEASIHKQHLEDSYEIHLIKLFMENDKKIIFLDTLETILWSVAGEEFIDNFQRSSDTQIDFIKSLLEAWKQSPSYAKDCWRPEEYHDSLNLNKMILKNVSLSTNARNLIWHNTILESLRSSQSLSIITGYDHLYGKSGLFSLLKSHGYCINHILADP